MTERKGWIGVDFDGTLAYYDKWTHALDLGAPIPQMVARVKDWVGRGYEVRLLTARAFNLDGAVDTVTVNALSEWMQEHLGFVLPVTSQKDFDMIELWDDRAVQVETNTGEPVYGSLSRV